MPAQIILDTNFLMIPAQFGVDIFDEIRNKMDTQYELYVLSGTLRELDIIIEKDKNKHKTEARIAKKLIESKNIKILDSADDVDDELVRLSKNDNTIIATQDKELKKRIEGKKIVLRQKKYIDLVN